jgi:hypothetical protein
LLEVQQMLMKLGYLSQGQALTPADIARAVVRFQRHAARPYRMPQPDLPAGGVFAGPADGVLNDPTITEMRKWVKQRWQVPVGRIKLKTIAVAGGTAKLREDAADAWLLIVATAQGLGATLEGPYGDSLRPVRQTTKVGTSRYSFHYCGRAVDINQALANPKGQRYYVAQDPAGAMYWRIYCKTQAQDGSQGTRMRRGQVKWYSFYEKKEQDLPEGHNVDLTAAIQSTGKFERIHAQGGWQTANSKAEWWHFQFKLDKQATFLDEMELIGYDESMLRAAGWNTPAMLDHAPG